MINKRKFYGDTIIKFENSDNKNMIEQFKIEYYQVENLLSQENNDFKYGIEILKKSSNDDSIIEKKQIKNFTNMEEKVNNVLDILQRNKVTPISVDDIMEDLTFMGFISDKKKIFK